jgi:thiol-disulfide isomerase/thioredoxin
MKLQKEQVSKIMKFGKPVLSILIIVIVFQFSGYIMSAVRHNEHDDESEPGRTFNYNFTIKDLAGNQIDAKLLKNKVVFLNLWATWCGPCRKEMPSIQQLYNKIDHDKIAFVMLSLDNEADHQKVIKYISEKAFTFPVFETSGGLPGQLQVSVIPTTLVIGQDGKIKFKKTGTEDYDTDEFRQLLEQLATN